MSEYLKTMMCEEDLVQCAKDLNVAPIPLESPLRVYAGHKYNVTPGETTLLQMLILAPEIALELAVRLEERGR